MEKKNLFKRVVSLFVAVVFAVIAFVEPISALAMESKNVQDTKDIPEKNAQAYVLKKSGKTFELNNAAKQKLGQYDVLQGSCSDGQYAYYLMLNKNNEMTRILKTSLIDNRVIKFSSPLKLNHGNDVTYNADTNELVVINLKPEPFKLSVINPSTLKMEYAKNIDVPSKLPGASSKTLKKIEGYSAIGYSSERKQYVLRVKIFRGYLILDENMKPVKYVKADKVIKDVLNQGIDVDGEYIYDVKSIPGVSNFIAVYDWNGHFKYKVNIPVYSEAESIFHTNKSFYVGFYKSYNRIYYKTCYRTKYKTKTVYKTKKVRWKKINGKWKYKTQYVYKTKRVKWKKVNGKWKYKNEYIYETKRVKWKKVNGKWKYKYKKCKVRETKKIKVKYKEEYKVKCSAFARANYVYRVKF